MPPSSVPSRSSSASPARFLAAGVAALGLVGYANAADLPASPGLTPHAPSTAAHLPADTPANPESNGLALSTPVPPPEGDYPASDAAERVRQLERQVEQLGIVNRQQQEALLSLRNRLASSQSASGWVPLLGIGFGAMLLIAGSLGLQLFRINGQQRREREDARLQRLIDAPEELLALAAGKPVATPAPAPRAPLPSPAPAAAPAPVSGPNPPRAIAPTTVARVAATEATAIFPGAASRAVSVEEMLDLEQQADFFVALGQEESAIDLLMGHIRGGGGANPMPYLKLLDIHRRRGDVEHYGRLRDRFNLRFNAVAPAFDDGAGGGRNLEDYPAVVQRLVNVWPRPEEATAALSAVMQRHGGVEPFDLPAFRDLVLLAALAGDLAAGAGSASPSTIPAASPAPPGVDLLLPLEEAMPTEPTRTERQAAPSRLGAAHSLPAELISHLLVRRDRQAGAGLDLDLNDTGPAPREFTRPAAFTDVEQRQGARQSMPSNFDELDPPTGGRRR